MTTALAIAYAAIAIFAVAMTLNEGTSGKRHPAMRALGIVGSVFWPVTLLALIIAARLRRPARAAMGATANA